MSISFWKDRKIYVAPDLTVCSSHSVSVQCPVAKTAAQLNPVWSACWSFSSSALPKLKLSALPPLGKVKRGIIASSENPGRVRAAVDGRRLSWLFSRKCTWEPAQRLPVWHFRHLSLLFLVLFSFLSCVSFLNGYVFYLCAATRLSILLSETRWELPLDVNILRFPESIVCFFFLFFSPVPCVLDTSYGSAARPHHRHTVCVCDR